MPAKYRIKDTPVMCDGEKGDIVYACVQDDFNAAQMLTQMTNTLHVSVTLDPTGDYPCFPIPAHNLEQIHDQS